MEKYDKMIINYIKEIQEGKFFVIHNLATKYAKWGQDRFSDFLFRICKRNKKVNAEFCVPFNKTDMLIFYK